MQELSQLIDIEPYDIQLVFFDIDGTLLATNGQYSLALSQQINRLHQRGIKTAIASGRPSYAARFLIDELSIDSIGVFCTGAEVYDPLADSHLALHTLSDDVVYALYQRAKELEIYCELYTSKQYYIDRSCDLSELHSQHLRVEPIVTDCETLFDQPRSFTKLLLGSSNNKSSNNKGSNNKSSAQTTGNRECQTDDHVSPLRSLVKEFPQCEFAFAHFLARPDWEFASVISSSASKDRAFDQILSHYDIPASQVMALGDSHSDMDFIQRAGVGVAMGNASEEVKRVANYITLPADKDGVAIALQRLIK